MSRQRRSFALSVRVTPELRELVTEIVLRPWRSRPRESAGNGKALTVDSASLKSRLKYHKVIAMAVNGQERLTQLQLNERGAGAFKPVATSSYQLQAQAPGSFSCT